ncbi:riboflavin synthase subunit beta [Salipiger aestuarii]|uniref:6,7-dimethyl-8-ribityllumazine synthase n=1 Tax=Salipiger aestuarii TaxID=568098 RepID=A0A327XYL8_9RHOB|nr:6,7-dimethyl-8-ribityllumazine synthase [Salipiger aestuarii]EIE51317.1 riboflavin synthase subunit beta [Citreicella sp. 357]KAA8607845.1 riboflavin synthase subunit beta [Salipiger aestuarii]KAB2536282.1 riboflavin synthase subunit beta [Salipiger aestuarii]RAK14078.1 6,7-dimethyl-8-ribityllumazine synthase [Salipiger aestuarii]
MTKSPKFAFIRARWHADIVDRAHEGFLAELNDAGVPAQVDVYDVPGAFEMPLLARKLAETAEYDAIAAAALVVDGGVYRHDFVARSVVDGLMQAGIATGVPILSVSLTPHHFQPTADHIGFFAEHFVTKGREAAQAALSVTALYGALQRPATKAVA